MFWPLAYSVSGADGSSLDDRAVVLKDIDFELVRDTDTNDGQLMIVTGPTGSGKSTTLYSILNERNTPDVNITTVEDPVEYTLDGIHQVQVIREKGLDFSRALRSSLKSSSAVQ